MRTTPNPLHFKNPNFPSLAFTGVSDVFHLRQMTNHSTSGVSRHGFTDIDQMYAVGSDAITSQFSLNGKWLIVNSCKSFQNSPAPPDQAFFGFNNNMLLFKVETTSCH